MLNRRPRIITLLIPLLLSLQQCQAKANVTMQFGLTYDSSHDCDRSTYKVTVCVGQKHDQCRLFGPRLFYVGTACAAYGPMEVIHFGVDSVEEPLRVDATIKATSNDMEFQLQPVTANLTFPHSIDAKTKNLNIILQFQLAYTCVADYFGELCNVYCSSDAKEYRCSPNGDKICNSGYVKDNVTGACIYDRCGSMPNYCLYGGRCVNKAQDEENALDTTTMPICICPPTRMGARCEIFRAPDLPTTTTSTVQSTTTVAVPTAMANVNITSRPLGKTLRRQPKNNATNARASKDDDVAVWASGSVEQPGSEREIWYQVVIFTVVAVCLTILAFGVCLAAGCYVVRLKAKASLLRRHQASHFGEMQFVDGGCLNTVSGVGPGSGSVDGVGPGGGIPIYLQRCSSLDYNPQTLQRPPSVRSFALSRPPTTSGIPPDTAQTPTEQPFVFSNGFNRHAETLAWPGIYRSPAKTWGDFGFDTFTRAPPATAATGDMELSVHGDSLPTVNSPEAYACRHDAYGYLSELHNHLGDTLTTSAPVMNNMLTLRTSTILCPTTCPQASKSPIEVDGGTMGMRKNDFQLAPAPPPSEFADLVIK